MFVVAVITVLVSGNTSRDYSSEDLILIVKFLCVYTNVVYSSLCLNTTCWLLIDRFTVSICSLVLLFLCVLRNGLNFKPTSNV